MLQNRFAILDDDPDDQELVRMILARAGGSVSSFGTAADLFRALRTESYDALIVDWNLPDISGVEAVKRIRRDLLLEVPIILVTSRSEDHEVVEGLHAGADDFIIKPATEGILLARLTAVLRRRSNAIVSDKPETYGVFTFDVPRRSIRRDGVGIDLTEREFKLALALFRNKGSAISRDHLSEAVWGNAVGVESRTLDVHISRIRAKLGLSSGDGWRLGTVYGYGYRLEALGEAVENDTDG